MGGLGSGSKRVKGRTDEVRTLDIRELVKAGRLTPGTSFQWRWAMDGEPIDTLVIEPRHDFIRVAYRVGHQHRGWVEHNYTLAIDRIPCNFGGSRVWWRCPRMGCGRRVAILYADPDLACRHCHWLAYPSQTESPDDRATRRADAIRRRLKWPAGILNGHGLRPRSMQKSTFQRLTAKHDIHIRRTMDVAVQRLRLSPREADDLSHAACG